MKRVRKQSRPHIITVDLGCDGFRMLAELVEREMTVAGRLVRYVTISDVVRNCVAATWLRVFQPDYAESGNEQTPDELTEERARRSLSRRGGSRRP